jgi:hypothetical protein
MEGVIFWFQNNKNLAVEVENPSPYLSESQDKCPRPQ